MKPLLIVTNGHGETAIAERIALEIRSLQPDAVVDHFGLVGDSPVREMRQVGPRQAMPSGGLVAMGNLRNLIGDVRSGLLAHSLAQYRFLRSVRGRYGAAAAVGDVFALTMTLAVRAPTIFVGTAKSVAVAPYGPLEERLLKRARARFVRDEATAARLCEHGIASESANVIVDLFDAPDDDRAQFAVRAFTPALAVLPGSRESAYEDAIFPLRIVRELARDEMQLGAVLSVAANLSVPRFAQRCRADGWEVAPGECDAVPFTLRLRERTIVRAWSGRLAPVFKRVVLVLGQAGTANEAAAAGGLPVVAFESQRDRKGRWYRRRQRGLLGDALLVLPDESSEALSGTRALLGDPARRARMGVVGRERMGAPGGAHRIAERIVAIGNDG